MIVTSANQNKKSLILKYPEYENKLFNNYFGYIKKVKVCKKISEVKTLNIAYSGSMLSNVQKPEILLEALKFIREDLKIKIYFIGDYKVNKNLKTTDSRVVFIDYMPHDQYLSFMINNIDIGFLSLSKEYYGACVPSKIYEYINLELPMIAALPDGDGIEIINKNQFGLATHYSNIPQIAKNIEKLANNKAIKIFSDSIKEKKKEWSMKERIKDLNLALRSLF